MLKGFAPNILLALLSGTLLLGGGCTTDSSPRASRSPDSAPETVAAPNNVTATASMQAPAAAPPTQPDPYKLAVNKADSARNISQSAQSPDDWNLVVSRWKQAIQLMKSVPAASPYRVMVSAKLKEYQQNLVAAQRKASHAASSTIALEPSVLITTPDRRAAVTTSPARVESPQGNGPVHRVRIKRRAGGTPVIDVTFNGQQTFEMIVDTGASGTVITQEMAQALGVRVVGRAKVDTASDRNVEVPLAYINSISVAGAKIQGVIVAIGGSALEVGLLGHDFFGDYDVTVKRDVVEFRSRA